SSFQTNYCYSPANDSQTHSALRHDFFLPPPHHAVNHGRYSDNTISPRSFVVKYNFFECNPVLVCSCRMQRSFHLPHPLLRSESKGDPLPSRRVYPRLVSGPDDFFRIQRNISHGPSDSSSGLRLAAHQHRPMDLRRRPYALAVGHCASLCHRNSSNKLCKLLSDLAERVL